MRNDDFNELPPWEDDEFDEDDEGENWKPNPTKEACKAMYAQWNEVMTVLRAGLESLEEAKEEGLFDKEHIEDFKGSLLGDAFEVAVKIRSSESGMYIIRMENASIIRKNAQYIKISTNGLLADGLMSAEYRQVIRNEIDTFRELFKAWVRTFEKDEFEDEWGLFI
jgi:hypothetical protein